MDLLQPFAFDLLADADREPTLLLICRNEAARRSVSRSLQALRPLPTRALGKEDLPLLGASGVALVVGLPLDDSGTFRHLRAALQPLLDRQVPLLWLLDRPSTRDAVQAWALGADAVLPGTSPGHLIRSVADQVAALRTRRTATRNAVLREVGARLAGLSAPAAGEDGARALVATVLRRVRRVAAARGVAPWLNAMSAVHHPTYRHCLLAGSLAAALAAVLGLDQEERLRLVRAALLHDVGKALVPVRILDKPGPLAPAEMETLRAHPRLGFEMLQALGDQDPAVLSIVRHHHELLDGSGYPSGLRGDEIDRPLRLATICDIFAALIEERPYKPGYAPARALEVMAAMGDKLDQDIIHALTQLIVPRPASGVRPPPMYGQT